MAHSRKRKAARTVDGVTFFRTTCPHCGQQNTRVRSSYTRCRTPKRYHYCPDCDTNFHSTQASPEDTLRASTNPKLWPEWHKENDDAC